MGRSTMPSSNIFTTASNSIGKKRKSTDYRGPNGICGAVFTVGSMCLHSFSRTDPNPRSQSPELVPTGLRSLPSAFRIPLS